VISVREEIAVPAPPARVWAVLSDPSAVVSCVSGAELGAAHQDGSFDGSLLVRFGAVRVRFAARVELVLTESGMEGRLSARGRDGQAATRFSARATFRVVPDGTGGARVPLDGEVQLNGKLAGLIESGAGAVVARMAKDFSAQLVDRCTATTATGVGVGTGVAARPVAVMAARPTGLRGRLRAWWARLWKRRRPAPAADQGGTT
jgi:carbon monoxide dehydrogenase subunit G